MHVKTNRKIIILYKVLRDILHSKSYWDYTGGYVTNFKF